MYSTSIIIVENLTNRNKKSKLWIYHALVITMEGSTVRLQWFEIDSVILRQTQSHKISYAIRSRDKAEIIAWTSFCLWWWLHATQTFLEHLVYKTSSNVGGKRHTTRKEGCIVPHISTKKNWKPSSGIWNHEAKTCNMVEPQNIQIGIIVKPYHPDVCRPTRTVYKHWIQLCTLNYWSHSQ